MPRHEDINPAVAKLLGNARQSTTFSTLPFLATCAFLAIGALALSSLTSTSPPPSTSAPSTASSATSTGSSYHSEVGIGKAGYLRDRDGDGILVFKSLDAMSKVQNLNRAAGGTAEATAIIPYLSCVPPADAKVLVITGEISSAFYSGASGTSDVEIISGPMTGCKGTVKNDWVYSYPKH